MGQTLGWIPGGVHLFLGQTKGQTLYPGRRGLLEAKMNHWGPMGWSTTATKVVVVRWSADAQGNGLPCNSVQGSVGPTYKFYKNLRKLPLNNKLGVNKFVKAQMLIPSIKLIKDHQRLSNSTELGF